jgi:hypothetical protein
MDQHGLEHRVIGKIAPAALLIAAGSPARADELQAVIAKYVAWRGGAAFEAMKSIREQGRIRTGGQTGEFDHWQASAGRFRQRSKLDFVINDEAVTSKAEWTRNTSGQIEDIGDLGGGPSGFRRR